MKQTTSIERIQKQIEQLSTSEQLELLERITHELRVRSIPRRQTVEWGSLYGLMQGIWDEDAQGYVNRLREERD